ncbi:MAG: hypothetical protein HY822_00535, partial [Acidobacteria bacterium]|nr:hypothetical protein [Acidobacteriota bacterium]
ALEAAQRAMEADPMHFLGGREKLLAMRALSSSDTAAWDQVWRGVMRAEPQNFLELATAYGAAGLWPDADAVLALSPAHPMVSYLRGYYRELSGDKTAAARFYQEAARGPADYVNPHRLEELDALQAALRANPRDARAHLFLGNLLYSKQRREEGYDHWRQAASLDPQLTLALRNVAWAERYLKKDLRASYDTYRKALDLNPADPRALLETDQVAESLKVPRAERFALFNRHLDTVRQRDDLTARLIDFQLKSSNPEDLKKAQDTLRTRHFHSWEGRYGIHDSWVDANQRLGDLALARKDYKSALDYFKLACDYPKNLEVAQRTPDLRAHVFWNLAKTHLAMGDKAAAQDYLKKILSEKYRRAHLGTFYQALARKALGDEAGYKKDLAALEQRSRDAGSSPIGQHLLALVQQERGQKVTLDSEAGRAALREAQIDFARAHQ